MAKESKIAGTLAWWALMLTVVVLVVTLALRCDAQTKTSTRTVCALERDIWSAAHACKKELKHYKLDLEDCDGDRLNLELDLIALPEPDVIERTPDWVQWVVPAVAIAGAAVAAGATVFAYERFHSHEGQ